MKTDIAPIHQRLQSCIGMGLTCLMLGLVGCQGDSGNAPNASDDTGGTHAEPDTAEIADPHIEETRADGPPAEDSLTSADGSDVGSSPELSPEQIGQPCEQGGCHQGRCLAPETFPSGYCTANGSCENSGDCPGSQIKCAHFESKSYCAKPCDSSSQCRNGYSCKTTGEGTTKFCVPASPPTEMNRPDGSACSDDSQCAGGKCLGDNWPNGYCTTMECQDYEECARQGQNNRCLVRRGQPNFCVRMCDEDADCRDQYTCDRIGRDQSICRPNPVPEINVDPDRSSLDIKCGLSPEDNQASIDYTIPSNTYAYMITPFTRDRKKLLPKSIVPRANPGDRPKVRFNSSKNRFQVAPASLFGSINPLVMPPLESLSGQMDTGKYRLNLQTKSSDLCYYVLKEKKPGTAIDLNLYLVGVPGTSASSAHQDTDLSTAVNTLNGIYRQIGIEIGDIQYRDLPSDLEAKFAVLDGESELYELVKQSEPAYNTRDGHLAMNVFIVGQFQLSSGRRGGSPIGISPGLPGAAGLHGTVSSGIVITGEMLGKTFDFRGQQVNGNRMTGQVLAHEMGHFLGLFHTSEQGGRGYDPLDDTQKCTNGFPEDCPDLKNLMFPLAGPDHTQISPGQSWVVKVNPLTKQP